MRSSSMAGVAAGLLGLMSGLVQADTTDHAAALTPLAMGSAKEAGLRYGQAMGVARVCYGLRTTEAAARLEHTYQGADGEAFRAEAERILASWQDALSCTKSGGPNECRLIYEMSCRDAYREIGPEGSAFPGLVERMK
jgi:hypothetical protein